MNTSNTDLSAPPRHGSAGASSDGGSTRHRDKEPRRTRTTDEDLAVTHNAPIFIAIVAVLAFVTPPVLLVVWIPSIVLLTLAWRSARSSLG
jgi:hypothetical protein